MRCIQMWTQIWTFPQVKLLYSLDKSPGDNAVILSFSDIWPFQIIKGWQHRGSVLKADKAGPW